MDLLVAELDTFLYQEITIGDHDIFTYAMRPHLYIHNAPSGSLTMQIRDANKRLIEASETITIATMRTAFSNVAYIHSDFRFLIDAPLKKNTNYFIYLVPSGGYSFSESNYIGWCNDFDLRKVTADYASPVGYNSPLLLEIWDRKNVSKGNSVS